MDQTYKVGQTYFPKHPVKPSVKTNNQNGNVNPFNQILEEKLNTNQSNDVTFSTHAKQRLDSRGIHLDSADIVKLKDAVSKAEQKGVKDSLILLKDLAFVVNVPNRVVITTVDEASMREHVFTNIDGAVII